MEMTFYSNGTVEKHDKLTLTIVLNKERRERCAGGYTYLIENGGMAHTAFRTKQGLRRFLIETGLRIGRRQSRGWTSVYLTGQYRECCLMSEKIFTTLLNSGRFIKSKILSNGDYTTALCGTGIIYYLNPNCKRDILPYIHE